MKNYFKLGTLLLAISLYSCGGGDSAPAEETTLVNPNAPGNEIVKDDATEEDTGELKPSERVDMSTKGVGPITSVTLADEIDTEMAAKGQEIYETYCTACHKVDKTHIGPPQKGVLERRTPEWVMNMIINPERMVQEDPLAKELLIEFNGSPMANQGITEEQARALLEYFRTL